MPIPTPHEPDEEDLIPPPPLPRARKLPSAPSEKDWEPLPDNPHIQRNRVTGKLRTKLPEPPVT